MIHPVILNLFNLYCCRQMFMSFVPMKCLDDKYEIYSSLSDFGAPSRLVFRDTVRNNPDGRSATANAPLPPDRP